MPRRYASVWLVAAALMGDVPAKIERWPSLQNYPMSSELVSLTVGMTDHLIPRNYIFGMDNFAGGPQVLVTIRATFPDMKPLTPDTRECLSWMFARHVKGCIPIAFNLERPQVTNAEGYTTLLKAHSVKPVRGPEGYDNYVIGQDGFGLEVLVKYDGRGGKLAFFCDRTPAIAGETRELVLCHGTTRDRHGNAILFLFPISDLAFAADMQHKMESLVDSFVTQERSGRSGD